MELKPLQPRFPPLSVPPISPQKNASGTYRRAQRQSWPRLCYSRILAEWNVGRRLSRPEVTEAGVMDTIVREFSNRCFLGLYHIF